MLRHVYTDAFIFVNYQVEFGVKMRINKQEPELVCTLNALVSAENWSGIGLRFRSLILKFAFNAYRNTTLFCFRVGWVAAKAWNSVFYNRL